MAGRKNERLLVIAADATLGSMVKRERKACRFKTREGFVALLTITQSRKPNAADTNFKGNERSQNEGLVVIYLI